MDFYKFWQIINESKGIKNEWDPNEPDEGPEDFLELETSSGEHEMKVQLVFKNGAFHDAEDGRAFPPIPYPPLQSIIGEPNDTYTMETRIVASANYIPGWDAGGGSTKDDELYGDINWELDGTLIENDRTKKSVGIPNNFMEDKVIGYGSKSTYKLDLDFMGRKIAISVR